MKYYLIALAEILLMAGFVVCMCGASYTVIAKMPRQMTYQILFVALASGCFLFLTIYMAEGSAYDKIAVWRAKEQLRKLAVTSALVLLGAAIAGIGMYYIFDETIPISIHLRYAAALTALLLAPGAGKIAQVYWRS